MSPIPNPSPVAHAAAEPHTPAGGDTPPDKCKPMPGLANAQIPKVAVQLDPREAALGKYVQGRQIGNGGICRVFEAHDVGLDRTVAIKVLRKRYGFNEKKRRRLVREGRLTAKVKSDHVIEMYRVAVTLDGIIYLVMPRLCGESLASRLQREAIPPLALTLKVARDMAHAVAACHACGVIHRDLKPLNIWLESRPDLPDPPEGFHRAVLFDFGFAKKFNDPGTLLTQSFDTLGTPQFMSPEMTEGGKQAGPPADVFALGVTLYLMATGSTPYTQEVITQFMVAAKLADQPPLPARPAADINPAVPRVLSDLIGRMIAPEPGARPSAAEVLRLVQDIRPDSVTVADSPTPDWRDARAAVARPRQKKMIGRPTKDSGTVSVPRAWLWTAGGVTAFLLVLLIYLLVK